MNVALYLKHFPAAGAPLIGGTAIAVDGLAAGLARNGAAAVVLCEGAARSSWRSADGYRIECFPRAGGYRSFSIAPALQRYAARELRRSALCLLNGMFHPSCFAFGRVLRRLGVPYVAMPHDPYDRWMFARNAHLKWPYWYLFERRHLREASAVQLLDRRHEEPLRRLGIDTPVIETPNGVHEAAAASLAARYQDSSVASLVFLGRMDAYNKGLDTLVDAFARVAPRVAPRMTLTLRGPDWGDRARLERRAASHGLDGRVAFLAPDYARPGHALLAEHDVFCLPSRFEGFGLAALEAMLAGLVLLVSERAGVARHVLASGCGLSVPPTVDGVAGGLHTLIAQREHWADMGRRGREYVLARLRWERIAADALHSYARLLR